MAYGYNYGYQNMFQQNVPMSVNSQNVAQMQGMMNSTGIIWVQGESGAKSYMVAPNTTVPLWDSEEKVIYLKSADASGMPSMKIIDYTIRNDSTLLQKDKNDNADFVTHDELEKFKSEIKKMIEEVDGV